MSYFDELLEKYDKWENLVKDLIKNRLYDYKDEKEYGCDLADKLFESENCDGSFTYNTNKSKDYINQYWEEYNNLYDEWLENTGVSYNPIENPEKFVVLMLLLQAERILGNNKFIQDNWNDEIILNAKNIDKIIKDIK